jgi:lactoylglutathione lyase
MAKYTWDHIHLRSPNPEATAAWFERMLGAEVIRSTQQGKPRIDLKLGGANIFIAPVASGEGVNPPPSTPYQGLDHFGLMVSDIDAVAAELKAKGVAFTRSRPRCGRACAFASSAARKAFRSSCWTGTPRDRRGTLAPCPAFFPREVNHEQTRNDRAP